LTWSHALAANSNPAPSCDSDSNVNSAVASTSYGVINVCYSFTAQSCGLTTALGTARFVTVDTLSPVIGADAMDESYECVDGAENQQAYDLWSQLHANATATDGCNPVFSPGVDQESQGATSGAVVIHSPSLTALPWPICVETAPPRAMVTLWSPIQSRR